MKCRKKGRLVMNYAQQALRESYQSERPTPQRNENDPGVCVTEESLSQFLDSCHQRGVSELTMRSYEKYISALYDLRFFVHLYGVFLPSGKNGCNIGARQHNH